MRQSFLDTIFNESEIAEDEPGYDKEELEEAFVKHFIKGYPEEEADKLQDKIDVVIEKYVKNDMFNETLVRECPFNPKNPWGCSFYYSALEDRTDLELTIGQAHTAMVLQYQIQGHTYYGDGIGYGWNDATSVTDIGDCFSITPYYLGPGDYDPDAVMEDKYLPKTLSGPSFGVDVLLDAETFDNGDFEEPFNGFNIAVTDPDDDALFGLNSFSVKSGSLAKVSNHISIHKTTDVVLKRFNSTERKCIDDSDNFKST